VRDTLNSARQSGDTAAVRALQARGQGRRRQGGTTPGEINLRPAEGPIGGAAGGGAGEGGGGFGGGRNGNLVDPGDYVVTITAAGQTMRQYVHVERVGEIINSDFGPEEDDDPDAVTDPIDP
jgi:hypothetical protein